MSSRYMQYSGPDVAGYLKKAIKMRAGLTPFGEPRYRLVWGPLRLEQAGGIWHDWDERLSVNDRNYVDRKGNELNKPIRVVEELRWVPKYPSHLTKWILEKWCRPSDYGTPEQWFSTTAEGGTCYLSATQDKILPLLGDYPWQGDYEDTGYAFPSEALTEGIILNAIGRIEKANDLLPATMYGRALRAEYQMKQREETREKNWEKNAKEVIEEAGWAFHGASFSSGAGEKRKSDREATADRLGINLHTQQ